MYPLQGSWYYNGGTYNPQQTSSGGTLQGSSPSVQGSSPTLQSGNAAGGQLQVGGNPMNYSQPGGSPSYTLGATTSAPVASGGGVDPAAAAAAAKAAEDARKAGLLRGEVTNLVNAIKDIFNQRYGQVDAAAAEQTGKLDKRFENESGDITRQVDNESQKIGAAHAASGSYDSSYRGNNVDTVTHAGEAQIRDLGTELEENRAKIGSWVTQQKAGFAANKGGMDAIAGRLKDTTDLGELTQLRNQLESRITELRAGAADNNTVAQNKATLEGIAPSSSRAVQLKTTLSQIVAGNADKSQKSAIGEKLITSAGLAPEDQKALLDAFKTSLAAGEKKEQTA